MKRFFAFVLLVVMLLSLCACGGTSKPEATLEAEEAITTKNGEAVENEEHTVENIITAEDWRDVCSDKILSFNEDGTGIFDNAYNTYDTEWKLNNDTISLSYVTGNGNTVERQFIISEENDDVRIIQKEHYSVFVPTTIYDEVSSAIRRELINTASWLDLSAMMEDIEANEARAKYNYSDKLFKFGVYVSSISNSSVSCRVDWGNMSYTHATIELPLEQLIELNPGDEITVVGCVSFFSIQMPVLSAFVV